MALPFQPVPASTAAIAVDVHDLAEKVEVMRRLQMSYFQTRDREVLAKCKSVEKEVDAMCRAVLMQRRHCRSSGDD